MKKILKDLTDINGWINLFLLVASGIEFCLALETLGKNGSIWLILYHFVLCVVCFRTMIKNVNDN